MPHIKSFVYCEGFQNEMTPQGVKPHLVNPLLNIVPQFVPGTFTFSVWFSIQGIELNRSHTIRYTFLSPKVNEAPIIDTGDVQINVLSDPALVGMPNNMQGINLNLDFKNVVLRNDGEYNSEVFLNGESLGKYSIYVYGKEKL